MNLPFLPFPPWIEERILAPLQQLLELGGPVVLILLLMSVTAGTLLLLKFWQLRTLSRRRLLAMETALNAWLLGNATSTQIGLRRCGAPARRLLEEAFRLRTDSTLPEPLVREELARLASRELDRLQSHFRTLEMIGTLAPLLGLLGTVLGMISAFQELEAGGNRVDVSLLSNGIWEALLTTAVGLAVAIPVVAILVLLERRVDRFRRQLEDVLTQLFTRPRRVPSVGAPHEAEHSASSSSLPSFTALGDRP